MSIMIFSPVANFGDQSLIKSIFAKNFARNYEKNNAWNMRRLVDLTTQRIILNIVGFLHPSLKASTHTINQKNI